jgi:hypothetical protein
VEVGLSLCRGEGLTLNPPFGAELGSAAVKETLVGENVCSVAGDEVEGTVTYGGKCGFDLGALEGAARGLPRGAKLGFVGALHVHFICLIGR